MVRGFMLGMFMSSLVCNQQGIIKTYNQSWSQLLKKILKGHFQTLFDNLIYSKPFTYAICLDQLGAEVVQKYIGREPSGRNFNEIALDYKGISNLKMNQNLFVINQKYQIFYMCNAV